MQKSLVWFRRDLRDFDHAALYHALSTSQQVYGLFVFDTEILDKLSDKADRRVEFIWECVRELKASLLAQGGNLMVRYGTARALVPAIAANLGVQAVFSNRDYEPAAIARDADVAQALAAQGIAFHQSKDQVLFEQAEVMTQTGKPFSVFTPYKNAHLKKLDDDCVRAYPVAQYSSHFAHCVDDVLPSLESMGFQRTNLATLKLPTGMSGGKQLFEDFVGRMAAYKEARDFPAIKGPSYLSVHLRFGTVSIRQLARTARQMGGAGAESWLSELIWRDFYFQILHHHPHVASGNSFKPEYQHLPFSNDASLFSAWCQGNTGYPLVDAGMRQLNQTGWMHNRLRMVTASFLVKDLLIDWRLGEGYFADKLIDFDLSANNGGWQWAASTGCDAQPYFRIFNPVSQSERFDPAGKFLRKYVPELAACNDREIHAPWQMSPERQQTLGIRIGKDYPMPVVEHSQQRARALALYKSAV